MPKRNAYAAFVDALTEEEFGDLLAAVSERRCREKHGFGTFAETAEIYRPAPAAPVPLEAGVALSVLEGPGKPSSKRIKDALLPHIAPGSVIVHDKERSHNAQVSAAGCEHEAYKADVRDPVYLECMTMVNSLSSWLKRYLWRFTGMDPKNLQSYLNWFVYLFRVNQARGRWPETARVVRHLLMNDASFRSST